MLTTLKTTHIHELYPTRHLMRWSIVKNLIYVMPMNGGRISMLKYDKTTNYYLKPREPNGSDTLLKAMATAYTGQILGGLQLNIILSSTRKRNR